jgi:hypothetical protein
MLALVIMMLCGTGMDSHEEAVLLHAQGQLAEIDGKVTECLQQLRQAHALAPGDEAIAFDLARVAMLHPALAEDNDTDDFLDLEPGNADSRVLAAYLLALKREVRAAKQQIDRALALDPAQPEAVSARGVLDAMRPGPDSGLLGLRLRVTTEYDSDVSLLPQDLPSDAQGWRANVDAGLRFTPARGVVRFDLNLDLQGRIHILDRDTLSPYDVLAGTGWFTLAWDPGPVSFTLNGVGAYVDAGEQEQSFLRQGYGLLEMRVPIETFAVGAFGMAGYRIFGFGNPIGDNDRTGLQGEAGLFGDWHGGPWAATARAGYITENARGTLQQVHGATAALSASVAGSDWSLGLALAYAYRDYLHNPLIRHDHVIEPALQGTYALSENFSLVGSYAFVTVQSLGPYTYNRHLVEGGVEALW